MMTRREIYTLKWGQYLIGPKMTFGRYLRGSAFCWGRPTRIEFQMGPNGALESYHISDVLKDWQIATPEQMATIDLLFNPIDDFF